MTPAVLSLVCPGCRAKLRLPSEAVGKAVRCPRCAFSFRVKARTTDGGSASHPAPVGSGAGVGAGIPSASANRSPSSGSNPVVAQAVAAPAVSLRPQPTSKTQLRPITANAAATETAKNDVFIGRVLGQYKLVSRLGRGAKGIVYEGEDQLLGRRVAVKILSPEVMAGGPAAVQRFLLEARAASRLEHPNCVGVYNIGKEADIVYFAMPLVKGASAMDRLDASGPLEPAEATRVVAAAARGLHAAHQLGIIHRDVKPANIMLGENGEVRVADFGMAKTMDNAIAGLTEPGRWLGTPHYMSPEQCQGLEVDARADVYSLGCTYYCLLVGRPPFSDINPMAVVYRQITATHPDPRTVKPNLPGICVRILDRAMAKQKEFRYQSAAELASALESVEQSLRQTAEIEKDAERAADSEANGNGWTGETEGLESKVLDALFEAGAAKPDDAPAPEEVRFNRSSSSGSAPLPPVPDSSSGFPGLEEPSPPSATSSGRMKITPFKPQVTPEWMTMPATVTFKLRFESVGEAKAGWGFLSRDLRGAMEPEIAPALHRGKKSGMLEIKLCQSPEEALRIVKTLVCAGGEFVGLVTKDNNVAEWLKRTIGQIKKA